MCGHFEEAVLEPFNKVNRAIFETVTPSIDAYWLKENRTSSGSGTSTPSGHRIKVLADLAGFNKDDISATLDGNILSIEASRKPITETHGTHTDPDAPEFRIIYQDRPEKIHKKIILPFDPENKGKSVDLISTTYTGHDGVLIVEIGNIQGIQEQTAT